MSERSKRIALEVDRGMRAYVEIATRNGADAKTSEIAFKAGAMWAMQCILGDEARGATVEKLATGQS